MDNDLEISDLDEVLADLTAVKKTAASSPHDEGQLTVDVYQTDKEIVIQSTIAGVSADDIDISIAKDMVTIKGHREKIEKTKQADYFHQELYWGAFSRSIILPFDINIDKAKASIKNGLLTIRLPKL